MEYAWVNPANTTDIQVVDLDGQPLVFREGGDNSIVLPIPAGGTRRFGMGPNPVPEWDLYTRILDTTPAPGNADYYTPSKTYAFSGLVQQPTGQVQETNIYTQIPIEDLYQIKLQEIANQDTSVRYNAVDTALSANWWLIVTERARSEISSTDRAALRRKIDGLAWPGGANIPLVGIFNAVNLRVRRERVTTEATWETLMNENAMHDQATGNASDASRASLDDKYNNGAGDWQEVADHDAADPAWGYPPTVTLPPSARNLLG